MLRASLRVLDRVDLDEALALCRRDPVANVFVAARLRAHGIRTYAADGAGHTLLPDADLSVPHCWVMGNEAWGLDAAVREACADVVRVPIHGRAESLNLAMAATVCLYASAGQHDPGASGR